MKCCFQRETLEAFTHTYNSMTASEPRWQLHQRFEMWDLANSFHLGIKKAPSAGISACCVIRISGPSVSNIPEVLQSDLLTEEHRLYLSVSGDAPLFICRSIPYQTNALHPFSNVLPNITDVTDRAAFVFLHFHAHLKWKLYLLYPEPTQTLLFVG